MKKRLDLENYDHSFKIVKLNKSGRIEQSVKELPWIEKYRPSEIKDIVGHTDIVNMILNSIKSGSLPHLLLHGPPGTGKTSTILALTRSVFGKELSKSRVVELNASDDRGINAVREKIKTLAKFSLKGDVNEEGVKVPPYKIIILDEADSMTGDAQSALRKIMEDRCGVTRFVIICNYVDKILDAIKSRCAIINFPRINISAAKKKIIEIIEKEKLEGINDNIIDLIVSTSDGDLRKGIMTLQNVKYYLQYFTGTISKENVFEISGFGENYVYENIFTKCKILDAKDVVVFAKELYRQGFPINNILKKLLDVNLNDDGDDIKKAELAMSFSTIQKRLVDGSNEYLEMINILLNINKIYNI